MVRGITNIKPVHCRAKKVQRVDEMMSKTVSCASEEGYERCQVEQSCNNNKCVVQSWSTKDAQACVETKANKDPAQDMEGDGDSEHGALVVGKGQRSIWIWRVGYHYVEGVHEVGHGETGQRREMGG